MTIDYRNAISIAELIVYVPALAIAILLCIRHGFGKSSGWFFLIIFSLARIIGPIMQLLTISNPRSVSLYTGVIILQTVGLSPLILACLGLLSRALESIQRNHPTVVSTRILKLVELIVMVGLILGIVGGTDASKHISSGVFRPGSLNKAGTALFVVAFAAIVLMTAIMSFSIAHAEAGEKRVLLAVALSLPFLFVRLLYSCLVTFTSKPAFNQLTGSATVLLCVALLEEFVVVVVYELVGLTLQSIPKDRRAPTGQHHPVRSVDSAEYATPTPSRDGAGAAGKGVSIAQKTIIGRLVTRALDSRRASSDVEMGTRR
ncbi:hypothetical protein PVAG01_04939 [Phlyctema vagabunda]|uniref:DUF7702 domain-containing protein n=1 Tax=Phlyctema vagabunda TaxID=108571 RepID=A0ABR4PIN2_9HELO